VIDEKVRISTFAVSYGEANLTININKMPSGEASLDDVVNALQAAGATTRDLIEVLKLMDKAGALHATLIIM
jgi:flagellar basal body P-ring protein FlgI